MAAISETQHRWFIQRMELLTSPDKQELIQEDLDQLRQLYRDYHSMLHQLRQLAEEYETTRQNIRLKLRQQQQVTRQSG
jgi:predicted patatin/cPLA2 family phospholipase